MLPPHKLQQIRFAVRETTAFLGHSFADEDERLVEQLRQFLSKLGVKCDSGKRAEPKGISEKVRHRIQSAELFVGIFTRRQQQEDGSYSTSAWVIEEKATALASGKRLLLFVENGVREFGGLQGDYEFIPFDRGNLGEAIIQAMDYVLAITSIPITCRVEGPNRLHFQIGAEVPASQRIEELRKFTAQNPLDLHAHIELAKLLHAANRGTGQNELRKLITELPNAPQPHHELAHQLEDLGDTSGALLSFQRALDLGPTEYRNYRCYGKCLHRHAIGIADTIVKRSSLEKARRLLERAVAVGGPMKQAEVQGDLFVVDEALKELPRSEPPGIEPSAR